MILELKGAFKVNSIFRFNLTSPELSTFPRDILAPCSLLITDKLVIHAPLVTIFSNLNSQPGHLLSPQALKFPSVSLLCELCFLLEKSPAFFSQGSGFYFRYSWTSALRYVPDSLVPRFCIGFPSERGVVEELLQHGRTLSQVQGGLWQSPWPGYCVDQGLSWDLGFPFSHCRFEVVGVVRTLQWNSCPLFCSIREKKGSIWSGY